MKPYLERIKTSKDSSWTLFDRRLPAIPFEWHYNSEYELTLTLNSRGQRFVGDNIGPYEDGDLILIGPRIPHTWCSSGDVCAASPHQAVVLWFSEEFVQSLIRPHVELRPVLHLLHSSSRALDFSQPVRSKARPLICTMLHQSAEDRLPALLHLLLLLSRDREARSPTSAAVQPESSGRAADDRVGRVLSYLHQHYREETELSRLSQVAGMSRSSLHRQFKLQAGMTLTDYVSQLRIGNACALLINTDKPIALIADDVGYQNLANFNRQFKAQKKQTPRQFRSAFAISYADFTGMQKHRPFPSGSVTANSRSPQD
jgi:AraC-like DNA-binding protein